jgi:metal-responsive CopG/Arc/MetJ family transcriptional regulator
MRTTVEIPDPLYRRVRELALARGMRGFSPIVEEALREYLESEPRRRDVAAAVRAAEGTWSDADVAELEAILGQGWARWRSALS